MIKALIFQKKILDVYYQCFKTLLNFKYRNNILISFFTVLLYHYYLNFLALLIYSDISSSSKLLSSLFFTQLLGARSISIFRLKVILSNLGLALLRLELAPGSELAFGPKFIQSGVLSCVLSGSTILVLLLLNTLFFWAHFSSMLFRILI